MSWKDIASDVQASMEGLAATQPEAVGAFGTLHEAACKPAALDAKQKELIALSIGISKQCVDCIGFHVQAAIAAGATRAEIEETVNVCVLMGGGPAFMYGVKALKAFDEMTAG